MEVRKLKTRSDHPRKRVKLKSKKVAKKEKVKSHTRKRSPSRRKLGC